MPVRCNADIARPPTGRAPRRPSWDAASELLVALRSSADVVICDAQTSRHLRAIAAAAVRAAADDGVEWLSVDPGPFGAELAEHLRLGRAGAAPPVLVVSGSLTRATRDQLLEPERRQGVRFVDLDAGRLDVEDVLGRLQDCSPRRPPQAPWEYAPSRRKAMTS